MDGFTITLPHIFVVLGLLMVLAELAIGIETGLDLVLIGSILIMSGFVGIFFSSAILALLIASVLGVLYIAVGRKKVKQKITTVTKKTNIDKLLGATATVTRDINPDSAGIVRVNDEKWRAAAEEVLYEGDMVTIEGIEGVTVIVRKLSKLTTGE